jgi:predicted permease
MRWLTQLSIKLAMLFRRGRAGQQLNDELRFHVDQQVRENRAAGMSPEEARRAALRSFGNPGVVREQARANWSWTTLELLLRDLHYGVRGLARSPGFAAIAILVMALGIGANVAMFTVVRSVLLKPLPFRDPDKLVRLYEQTLNGRWPYNSSAGGVFTEWKKQSRGFTDLAMYSYAGYSLSGTNGQLPETVRAANFSSNMLPTLGLEPALGRGFTADDDQPSANGTVLLSWGLWKRRFGGDPAILHQTILLDAKPFTVIGVMPAWFAFPDQAAQLWAPVNLADSPKLIQALDDHHFKAIGRLKPGVTPAQAVAELTLITHNLHVQNAGNPFISDGANIRPLLESIVGDVKTPLYVLLAATGCVLLIACLNVANLLVARSAVRRKELAIRSALGAGRVRLLRERLTESLLLSAAGGTAGLVLAQAALAWLIDVRKDLTRVDAIHIDVVVVAFTVGLILLSAVFSGLISASGVTREQPSIVLQESSRSASSGDACARLRKILLAIEVGLTVVLLTTAGLLLKSYSKLHSDDLGCLTSNVLTMTVNLPASQYDRPRTAAFFDTLLARVRSYPGIRAAGLISPVVPGDGQGGDNGFTIVGRTPLPPGHGLVAEHRWVDPGYFAAIGIPMLSGRSFGDNQRGDHATELIVSDAFRRQFFPGEDPLSHHVIVWGKQSYEIVGVAGDTRVTIGEPPPPMIYFPLYVSVPPAPQGFVNDAALVLRSDSDVTQFALPVQKVFAQLDRNLPVSDILTMDQVIGRSTLDASFNATLLLAFAILSVVLAAVGLFGVLSYIVAQRTSEIGIRIALGAQREQVLRLVLFDGLRPALIGLAAGLAASAGATRLIRTMLYGTQPFDATVFAAVSFTLLLVAALACAIPAWRASRLDPMQALRTE